MNNKFISALLFSFFVPFRFGHRTRGRARNRTRAETRRARVRASDSRSNEARTSIGKMKCYKEEHILPLMMQTCTRDSKKINE